MTGDVPQALSAAQIALRHAEQLGPGPLLAEALAVEANVAFFAGFGLDTDKVERALSMEGPTRTVQSWRGPARSRPCSSCIRAVCRRQPPSCERCVTGRLSGERTATACC